MEPKIKYFLLINLVALSVVILYVKFFRKKESNKWDSETRERLKEGESKVYTNHEYSKQHQGKDKDYKNLEILDRIYLEDDGPSVLNVVFTWNGHDWNAYEVLGIPAGSTIEEINEAYEKALSKVDEKSQDFIKKAYRSICQKVS